MSSSTGDNGAFVATISGLLVSNYCTVSTTALFIYECAITLGDEVNLFWRRPLTGATALFVSNRLAAMIYLVYALIASFIPLSTQSCYNNIIASKAIQILQYFPWAAFSAMRGLALTHNWQLATFVFLLSVVPVAVNLAVFSFNVGGEVVPYIGCSSSDSLTVDMARRLVIVSRASLIIADLILIGVTWHRLSQGTLQHLEKGTFAYVLLRDGTVYFVALLLLNALHLTLTLLSFGIPFQNVSLVAFFTEPITAILVSRFLINLQLVNVKTTGMGSDLQSGGRSRSLVFERVIGSPGSSIPPGAEGEVDDEHDGELDGADAEGPEIVT